MLSSLGSLTPRRAKPTAMPTISVPSYSEKSPSGLPLPNGGDRRRGAGGLSPSRRLIQLVKSRGRWSTPFVLLVVAGLVLFTLTSGGGSKAPAVPVPRKTEVPAHNYAAGKKAVGGRVAGGGGGAGAGSKVTPHHDDDEFLADDEKAVDNAVEETSRTEEEIAAEGQAIKSKEAELAASKTYQLRSLIWWLAQNGHFSSDFEQPTEDELEAKTVKDFQDMLLKADPEQVDVFEDSWVVHAENLARVTMFSKTYCPYSKNGKNILKQYTIHPSPYFIELDIRDDGSVIQDLLQYLTGRRTVPNLVVDWKSIGGSDDMDLLHAEGGLKPLLLNAGTMYS